MTGRWEDASRPAATRAADLLDAATSRGAIKRLGAWLDGPGRDLRDEVVQIGRGRGADLPPGAEAWPGKKLIRIALARDAHQVGTPIARDEGFTCVACGAQVPPAGRTARNHCPVCLSSLHVDVVPGDRAAGCGGRMEAVAVSLKHGAPVLHFRCERCGATSRNRALLDVDPPDDMRRIAALSARPG